MSETPEKDAIQYKPATELVSGDILVGEMGGRVTVDDASPSATHPGFIMVTTEFGYLFLDDQDKDVPYIEGSDSL